MILAPATLRRFGLAALLAAFCSGASGQSTGAVDSSEDASTAEGATNGADSSMMGNLLNNLDATHDSLGGSLERTARRIDAFFGDSRAYEDANETRGQITLEANKLEGENAQFDVRVRAKVQLPRTERKLRLLVESDATELGQSQTSSSSPVTALQDTKFSLALETVVPGLVAWQIKPAIGVAAHWPPDPYVRVRSTRYFDLDPWLARFSANASYYAVAGPIATASLDFDRHLNDPLLFRAATSLKWEKDDDNGENTEASQALILFHTLSERSSASYSISANADSDDGWAIHSYGIGAAYRRAIHKDWLFAEVNPYVDFQREFDWDERVGGIVRVEAMFGP